MMNNEGENALKLPTAPPTNPSTPAEKEKKRNQRKEGMKAVSYLSCSWTGNALLANPYFEQAV